MLPLHTTFRIVTVSFSLFIITSCSDRPKADLEVIKALDESIDNSSQIIAESSKEIMMAFEQKLRDPASKERAQLWFPKASKTQQLSTEVFNYIDNIKKDINSKSNFSLVLFDRMMRYKNEILNLDTQITYEFEKSLGVFTKIIDSSKTDKRKLFQNYFNTVSTTAALAMLSKLQNNVRVIEGKITAFCYEQSSRLILGPCINDFPVVLINSTVVQAGEKIEVTAGVGSFYTNYNAEVFIYGKSVTVKDEGITKYRFKAASKPGRYYVPVKINYTDRNGIKKSMQKKIEYTVANIQKQ